MTYRVVFNSHTVKQFRKLPSDTRAMLTPAIRALADDPRPPGCRKMQGSEDHWRIRAAGTYRIVYTIDDPAQSVTVVLIAKRDEVYRR